jgi:hypothetical protein
VKCATWGCRDFVEICIAVRIHASSMALMRQLELKVLTIGDCIEYVADQDAKNYIAEALYAPKHRMFCMLLDSEYTEHAHSITCESYHNIKLSRRDGKRMYDRLSLNFKL